MTISNDQRILLTSGPIAVGKSSLVGELVSKFGFSKISSGAYLTRIISSRELVPNRVNLTALGDSLDEETDFRWVVDDVVVPTLLASPDQPWWIFDSVRKQRQVEHFRAAYPDRIYHIHLTAPDAELKRRYEGRILKGKPQDKDIPYAEAINTANEREARSLEHFADRIVISEQLDPSVLATEIEKVFREWSK